MDNLSNKTKRICKVFVRLNELTKMIMTELAIAKQGTRDFKDDEDFIIRAQAFSHVSAELLTVIFTDNGEDIKDIIDFMDECRKMQSTEMNSHMTNLIEMMSNPN